MRGLPSCAGSVTSWTSSQKQLFTDACFVAFVQRAMANGLNLFLLIISILEILLLQIGYVRCALIQKKIAAKKSRPKPNASTPQTAARQGHTLDLSFATHTAVLDSPCAPHTPISGPRGNHTHCAKHMPYHAVPRPAGLPAWVTHARRTSGQMRGKVKWEGMWVIFVECVAYAASLVSPDADFVSIRLTNGIAL